MAREDAFAGLVSHHLIGSFSMICMRDLVKYKTRNEIAVRWQPLEIMLASTYAVRW